MTTVTQSAKRAARRTWFDIIMSALMRRRWEKQAAREFAEFTEQMINRY